MSPDGEKIFEVATLFAVGGLILLKLVSSFAKSRAARRPYMDPSVPLAARSMPALAAAGSAPVPMDEIRATPGAVVEIEYVDRFGEVTARDVRLDGIFRDEHGTYLSAYCHLRGDDRTFRLDRILSLKDMRARNKALATAVYFSDWIAVLPEPAPSPEAADHSPRDFRLARPGLIVLMWMLAAAPGPDDDEVLMDYLRARLAHRPPLSADDEKRWLSWIAQQAPTFDVAAACVLRLNATERGLVESAAQAAVADSPPRARRARRLRIFSS